MAGYSVETDQLAAVESMLTDAAADARRRLEGLRHSAELLLGRWHGTAGTDYRHGWTEWHAGAVEMVDALHEMAVAVGLSGRDYAGTERSVRATAAGTSA